MSVDLASMAKTVFSVRWRPNRDLLALAVSWVLVVAALYSATFLVGSQAAGGMGYFALYAIVGALGFGIGIPLYWTVVVRKRPISDLGITRDRLALSLVLQVLFAVIQGIGAFSGLKIPGLLELLPLAFLALTIGLFEAIFWRGWFLLRLEECFGLIPAVVLGSVAYALVPHWLRHAGRRDGLSVLDRRPVRGGLPRSHAACSSSGRSSSPPGSSSR